MMAFLLAVLNASPSLGETTAVSAAKLSPQESQRYHSKRLYDSIFTTYTNSQSPYTVEGIPNATIGDDNSFLMILQYARLLQVYETQLQHESNIGYALVWMDPRLRWEPQEYGNVTELIVSQDILWKPEYMAVEASYFEHIANEKERIARIHPNGRVETFTMVTVRYSCRFSNYYFPFDQQQCYYAFLLPMYKPQSLWFKGIIAPSNATLPSAEWTLRLLSTSCHLVDGFDATFLLFHIAMKRQPSFWIGLIVVPTFLIGFMVPLGLFFSEDSHLVTNTVTLGLTSMTSMMVTIGILADFLAKSKDIPILGIYVIVEVALSAVAVPTVMVFFRLRKSCSRLNAFYHSEMFKKLQLTGNRSRIRPLFTWIFSSKWPVNIVLFIAFAIARIINAVVYLSNYSGDLSPNLGVDASFYNNCSSESALSGKRLTFTDLQTFAA